MIPKVIHYCWFGGNPLNNLTKKCIESWKKYCPDYEIVEWNENNFDINSNTYVKEAYESKKWAFVTDYVRLYVLYNYGGIYMDTDVELLHNLDNFLVHIAFSGFEDINYIPTGILGAEKDSEWIKYLLSYYDNKHFIKENGELDTTTNVITITNMTKEKYNVRLDNTFQEIDNVLTLYPKDYFCPKDYATEEIKITKNTISIHHFNASWISGNDRINRKLGKKQIFYKNKYGESYQKHYMIWYRFNIISLYIKEYGFKKGIEILFEKIINKF